MTTNDIHFETLKREWQQELADHPDDPSFTNALIRAFGNQVMFGWTGFLKLIKDCLELMTPQLMR